MFATNAPRNKPAKTVATIWIVDTTRIGTSAFFEFLTESLFSTVQDRLAHEVSSRVFMQTLNLNQEQQRLSCARSRDVDSTPVATSL